MTEWQNSLYDFQSEESVLGAMMISLTHTITALDLLEATDFYKPFHAQTFLAIESLISNGVTIDPITVSAEMNNPEALSTLMGLTINVANPGRVTDYARIVYDRSVARQMAMRLEESLQALKSGENPYEEAASIEKSLASLGSSHGTEQEALTMSELAQRADSIAPVVIPGMMNQDYRTIVVAPEGMGKALDVSTPILTTKGWSTMGDLVVGDFVFSPSGYPNKVVAATEEFKGDCYKLVFSDGSYIVADSNHLWLTETLKSRESSAYEKRRPNGMNDWRTQLHKRKEFPSVKTTKDILDTLWARDGHASNHSIDVCEPLIMESKELLISPYTFGAWLGDGTSANGQITCADEQILKEIISEGWEITKASSPLRWNITGKKMREGLESRTRSLGVWNNKHIPEVYKLSSFEQRLSLLQGLMDTDGTIGDDPRGYSTCEFSVVNERLARDVFDLLISLGIKTKFREGDAKLNGRFIGKRYRLSFQTELPVFRLERKLNKMVPLRTSRAKIRYIKSCEKVEDTLVRCIQVEKSDGMFLAGRNLIATHNSTILRTIGMCAAQGIHPFAHSHFKPVRVLAVDLENPTQAITQTGLDLLNTLKLFSEDFDEERWRIWRKPGGIDIRRTSDRAELQREIAAHKPDLVCIGPVYKMYRRKSTESYEDSADGAMNVLDDLRTKYNFALLLEHHAAKGKAGENRDMSPMGSQRWMAWPEAGISLYPDKHDPTIVKVDRFRGDRLNGVWWPDKITRDKQWLFNGTWEDGIPELLRNKRH